MAYTAPTLYTTIRAASYADDIDANFDDIQTALISIQNELPYVTGGVRGSNLTWVERCLRLEGLGGVESFIPDFGTDQDALTITHPGEDAISWCVMDGLYHQLSTESSHDLSLIAAGDGVYNCVIAAKTLGAPNMEMVVAEEDTDLEYDVLLYTFDLHRASGLYEIRNLRVATTVLMDRDAFDKALARDRLIPLNYNGTLPTSTGLFGTGFVAPFDLEITGAEFYLGTAPSGATVEVVLIDIDDATDGNVLAGSATWTTGQTGVKSAAGQSPTRIIQSGHFIQAQQDQADGGSNPEDLSILVKYRRVYHEPNYS